MLLISFIIPVFKVESYIHICVNSILRQTYENIELILVDDGSPDACPFICDEYAKIDKRIKVIHKQNGGLSDARNIGLMNATGDYVIFVDSDDFWIHDNLLEKLLVEVKKNNNCDFIGFNCSYYYEERNEYSPWASYDEQLLLQGDKDALITLLIKTGNFPISACTKIVKRDFLMSNHLFFINGLLSEDIPWTIQVLDAAKSFHMTNLYIYAYRQVVNSSSISHSFNEKHFEDILWIIGFCIDFLNHSSFSLKTRKSLLSFIAYEYCILIGSLYKLPKKYRNDKRKVLKNYTWLLHYMDHPKVQKAAWVYACSGFYFLELVLTKYMKNRIRKRPKQTYCADRLMFLPSVSSQKKAIN